MVKEQQSLQKLTKLCIEQIDFRVAIIKTFKEVEDVFVELRESITLMTEETRSHSR